MTKTVEARVRIRAELWRRLKLGERVADIARALETSAATLYTAIVRAGGIAPRPQKERASSLKGDEREEISRGLARGDSVRAMAGELGRSPSTISREIARNGGRVAYRAAVAEARAAKAVLRPKLCKLATAKRLRECVAAKLQRNWSPQQIAGWLRRRFTLDVRMQISHETIYRTLYLQARGALKKELQAHLRTRRAYRHPRRPGHTVSSSSIVDGISIKDRPASIEDRAVPGHWEGDLIFGTTHSFIATLVERQSRFTMLVKVASKNTKVVTAAIRKQILQLPAELRKSLTWDQGSEMSGHREFSVATGVDVYFCDPRSPWQRGTNENTNGLLRQYFPHGTDVSRYSQAELNRIARELNGRPRKTLDYQTPAEALKAAVALTG